MREGESCEGGACRNKEGSSVSYEASEGTETKEERRGEEHCGGGCGGEGSVGETRRGSTRRLDGGCEGKERRCEEVNEVNRIQ